jgi:hypothetical protein
MDAQPPLCLTELYRIYKNLARDVLWRMMGFFAQDVPFASAQALWARRARCVGGGVAYRGEEAREKFTLPLSRSAIPPP